MKDPKKREAFASLFSSRFNTAKKAFIRPPYVTDVALMHTYCLTCKEHSCVEACEQMIIGLDETHTPHLLFAKGGCTLCEACAKACSFGVLDVVASSKIFAIFRINIKTCLAWNGVVCNSCADVCNVSAIPFLGMFRPVIAMDKCTGCGFCYSVCPSNAVQYHTS